MRQKICAFGVVALAVLAGSAWGQSRSSFMFVDSFSGITVTQTGPLTFDVSLSASPTVTVSSTTYNITDLFGFWALKDADPDLSAASGASFGVWSWHRSTSGAGDIAGWKTNPNTGITPGNSESFTYSSLALGEVDRWGFHIRVDGTLPFGGDTFYLAVPTPGSLALLGLAGLAASRRRR